MSAAKPWEYLRDCSEVSLKNFQLLRQTAAANAKKEITKLVDELVDAQTDAEMCRLLLEDADLLAQIADHRQKVFHWEETRETVISEPSPAPARVGRPAARYRLKDTA
jgi:hypothetical protein